MPKDSKFWEVISERKSVRIYENRPVPSEQVREAIEAAILAPSAHNAQPWRFVLVNEGEHRTQLIKAMAQRFSDDMLADGVQSQVVRNKVKESIERFTQAPILLLACSTMKEMHLYPDTLRQRHEEIMAAHSLGAAVENLLLAFTNMGIASRWYCAPLFCQELVKSSLDLPRHFQPQAFITAGYSSKKVPRPIRKSITEIFLER